MAKNGKKGLVELNMVKIELNMMLREVDKVEYNMTKLDVVSL